MQEIPSELAPRQLKWLEQMPGGVFVYRANESEEILYANQKVFDIYGCDGWDDFYELTEGSFRNMVYAEDLEDIEADIDAQIKTGKECFDHVSYRIVTKDGKIRYIDDYGHMEEDEALGRLFFVFIVDMKTQYMSFAPDRVTVLPGMRHYLDFAGRILQSTDAPWNLCTIFFNIRNFKMYNVKHSIDEGDMVLRNCAELLREYFPDDFVSRFAEDHFVVLAENPDVQNRVEKFCNEFSIIYSKEGLSVKAGLYECRDAGEEPSVMCDLAKLACDSIRDAVDRSYCYYNDRMSQKNSVGDYVIREIDTAIANDYIKVYYQPVVRTINNAVCSLEALARWVDPVMGMMPPDFFIGPLEDSRQIYKLDLHMIELVCRQMRAALDNDLDIVPVSFNLSRIDFICCDMFAEIEKILATYQISREMLRVEITESLLIDDAQLVRGEMSRFQKVGYQVWMDDFGSGYSSLNLLKDYAFDVIKIDMAFLSSFTEKSKNIIRATVAMAKSIGVGTVAEGVETKEQYDFLRSMGCEKVQGYYFGKPMTLPDTMKSCLGRGLWNERIEWNGYYEKIGRINYMTERTLVVAEDDGTDMNVLFMNDAYKDVLRSCGTMDMITAMQNVNSRTSPVRRLIRDAVKRDISTEYFEPYDYVMGGQYMRLMVRRIVSKDEKTAYQVEIYNVSRDEDNAKTQQMDRMLRMIYLLYDAVYLVNLKSSLVTPVNRTATTNMADYSPAKDLTIEECNRNNAELYIAPEDRERFLAWVEKENVEQRIAGSSRGFLSEYFRTKEKNGTYSWKVHSMLMLPGTSGQGMLYTVAPAGSIGDAYLSKFAGAAE